MSEREAAELLKNTPLLRYEEESGMKSSLGDAMRMGIEALKKQEKLKERIAELTAKSKKNPWEEMFIGEVVKLLNEFVIGE